MWCPRCNQGHVLKVRIEKTGEIVHICEQCDALWSSGIRVTSTGFEDFKTYVSAFELKGTWSELTEFRDKESDSVN